MDQQNLAQIKLTSLSALCRWGSIEQQFFAASRTLEIRARKLDKLEDRPRRAVPFLLLVESNFYIFERYLT